MIRLPLILAVDAVLLALDLAAAAYAAAVCRVVDHDSSWRRTSTGVVRCCKRCGTTTAAIEFDPEIGYTTTADGGW